MIDGVEIIPAILTDDFDTLKRQLKLVDGLVERVQIDVVDKIFADNQTLGVEKLAEVATDLLIDVQLMVQEPVAYVGRCDWVGVERVFGQVEQMSDQDEFVDQVSALGLEVGLGLDLETPIEAIKDQLMHLDAVLLMAVEAGFSGQEFNRGVLGKIEKLRRDYPELNICVDGGLTPETARLCVERGASQLAVGSWLWKAKNINQALEELRSLS